MDAMVRLAPGQYTNARLALALLDRAQADHVQHGRRYSFGRVVFLALSKSRHVTASFASPIRRPKMTLEEFEQEVNRHDLTYSYSDDHSVWQRGSAHYAKIRKAADSLPREDVERVWNAMVDKRLIEDVRPQFYWRWPQ
jgi:hypothetical protein